MSATSVPTSSRPLGCKSPLTKGIKGASVGGDPGQDLMKLGYRVVIVTGREHHRMPVAKGQALPSWDPRLLKATGITYCTSAQDGDHTAGLVIDPKISGESAAIASQKIQIVNAICDSTGFCMLLGLSIEQTAKFFSPFFGEQVTREQIADIGWECLRGEWLFNEKAGMTVADDVMADCMSTEGIGPEHGMKFDFPGEIVRMAKVRQPPSEKFWRKSPAG